MTGYRTFTERVQARAAEAPGREALVLLTEHNGQLLPEQIAYAELDRAARSLAARLQTATAPGDRVVVLDSSRRLFATSFLACLYAGVVAVPAAPPGGRGHHDERVAGIVKDSTASCVLTSAREAAEVSQVLARTGYGHVTCLLADVATDHAELTEPDQGPDDIAFLQYTSGSTRDPRGAVVTHRNLLANLDAIGRTFRTPPGARLGGWLPFHHDMGLIGQLLYPLWLGGTAVLLSPLSFLKKPVRWLETISRYGLTLSGAPDFAYDLCVRGVTDEQLADLDLSCWQTAVNGGEPIRPETVQAFAERFAPAGLRPEALTPCYGLAEATLLVAAAKPEVPAARRTVDATALETHRLRPPRRGGPERTVAACGRAASCDLRIVDPITLEVLPDGRIGEIWVRGDSVVRGYWGRPAESSVTFGAQTADGRKGFLRTGDLGVVEEGLLYVTGRMKDVILVAGRNLYPQDLERTVQRVSSLFGSATAFGVPGEREHIVVVQELRARSRYDIDLDGLAAEVESRLAEEFEVQTGGVLLVRPGTVRKTTSGKVERGAMRELFLRGEIQPLHQRIGHDVARLLPGNR
ncbi:polyketide synthase [Streptomyces sp. CB03234]|uniref:fatty acyl-AMP ligase n=1 Tax=Streptomyces sp. (strain CB03234) TaxID=1703937 RepID=UPI000938A60A|nr:fatty acyl-AMP ligase [Streptomyces sp. CB03234]OKJ94672.1 polyketide synthase [Streptomyces sp. CB03234]